MSQRCSSLPGSALIVALCLVCLCFTELLLDLFILLLCFQPDSCQIVVDHVPQLSSSRSTGTWPKTRLAILFAWKVWLRLFTISSPPLCGKYEWSRNLMSFVKVIKRWMWCRRVTSRNRFLKLDNYEMIGSWAYGRN